MVFFKVLRVSESRRVLRIMLEMSPVHWTHKSGTLDSLLCDIRSYAHGRRGALAKTEAIAERTS